MSKKNQVSLKSDKNIGYFNFEVLHPRCVGSITKNFLCITYTVEHNYIRQSRLLFLC